MKKISTLSFGFLFSLASFAAVAPSRLTVSAEGNTNIKVTVDGNRFDQQEMGNSVIFDNLQPGYHSVNVYQLADRRFGMFGRRRGDDYRLVYSSTVNIRPLFATSILVDRFGRAQLNEEPMRGRYDSRGWNGDDRRDGRDNDHTWDRDRDRQNDYGRNGGYDYGYNRAISNEDFFAAERVMNRETDNGRLLYGKSIVNVNYLTAEQVKELARFFSFDNYRLDFVKYAYSKTIDKANFSVVCNAFASSDGRNQLMDFIRTCR